MNERSIIIAKAHLEGVGDSKLGQWIQKGNPGPTGNIIWHIRRRLSEQEQSDLDMHVLDLRRTDLGQERLLKLFREHPELKPIAIKIGEYSEVFEYGR